MHVRMLICWCDIFTLNDLETTPLQFGCLSSASPECCIVTFCWKRVKGCRGNSYKYNISSGRNYVFSQPYIFFRIPAEQTFFGHKYDICGERASAVQIWNPSDVCRTKLLTLNRLDWDLKWATMGHKFFARNEKLSMVLYKMAGGQCYSKICILIDGKSHSPDKSSTMRNCQHNTCSVNRADKIFVQQPRTSAIN